MDAPPPTAEPGYGPPATAAERARLAAVVGSARCAPGPAGVEGWMASLGHDNLRVLRGRRGRIEAGLGLVPMGQWFGGRRVATVGLAAVAAAPEARGRGRSVALVAAALREARRGGFALSVLYPTSHTRCRKNGYELAGWRFRHVLSLGGVGAPDRRLEVARLEPCHTAAVEALCRRTVCDDYGPLDRGAYLWRRIRRGFGRDTRGYGVFAPDGALRGYVYLRPAREGDGARRRLEAADLCVADRAAARRIATLLRDEGSPGGEVIWAGALNDPLTLCLSDRAYRLEPPQRWMLRVVDVAAALTGRGYFRGASAELHLDVDDPILPDNAGRWVLTVSAGEAAMARGGRGSLRLSVGALAQLVAGYESASALARRGRVVGPAPHLRAADALLRASTPWMSDVF
ncbi:MAG: hypothetical protein CSA24_00105 [Deltaproteobacteria bacterium]|nr:MAG: hypothetical protein CSA24_00105 [Deltaproteobacteria bacterium]